MTKPTVTYGKCVGVPGRVAPHVFYDGQNHHPDSHGLCPACRNEMLRLIERRYRKKAMLTNAARVALTP